MGKVVLTPALEAEFGGFHDPKEVCNARGKIGRAFLAVGSYKKLLANLEIPYSKDELARRRQEQGGSSLAEFWQTVGQS